MPKTAVGLFKNPEVVDTVVHEIESIGFPRNEIRILGEPLDLAVTGVRSIPNIDFEVDLYRELTRIGATKPEAEGYIDGVRHRGVLVFATGADEQADKAAKVMNLYGAVEIEETTGPEPQLPSVVRENVAPERESLIQAGRIREPGGGACLFVW